MDRLRSRQRSYNFHLKSLIFLGEVAEWLKAPLSKSGKPQKGFEGSNPSLSDFLRCSTQLNFSFDFFKICV